MWISLVLLHGYLSMYVCTYVYAYVYIRTYIYIYTHICQAAKSEEFIQNALLSLKSTRDIVNAHYTFSEV